MQLISSSIQNLKAQTKSNPAILEMKQQQNSGIKTQQKQSEQQLNDNTNTGKFQHATKNKEKQGGSEWPNFEEETSREQLLRKIVAWSNMPDEEALACLRKFAAAVEEEINNKPELT